jgi:hypothetical protein
MKAPIATAIAIAFGLIVVIGYFLQPMLDPILKFLLDWAVILAAIATLVGLINMQFSHWSKLQSRQKGAFYSALTILAFLLTIGLGIWLKPTSPGFIKIINAVQIPVEASLMGLVAISLAYASLFFLRQRKINILSVTFMVSVLIFLILNLGFIFSADIPILKDLALALNRLPVAGARGILLGIVLGSLMTGLRILIGADRPYGG